MKKIAYVMLPLVALCMTACGSSKEVKRESPIETFVMPCSDLKSGDGLLRAWGVGRSDNEATARKKARMQASAELAEQLEQVVLYTAKDYTADLTEGMDAASKSYVASTIEVVVRQTLKGSAIVCDEWHRDGQTGLFTNYVTIELNGEEFLNNLYKELRPEISAGVDKSLLKRLFLKHINGGREAATQSSVTGLVIEKKTGEPVIGASVMVNGYPTIGAVTDIDGKFVLKNIPQGATTLEISYVGMKTQEVVIHPYVKVSMERGRRR